jgi:hypothetical protein
MSLRTSDIMGSSPLCRSGDRLCGLVVRVLDYRCRGPGFDFRALQKKVVGLERGPLSLVEYKLRSYLIEK